MKEWFLASNLKTKKKALRLGNERLRVSQTNCKRGKGGAGDETVHYTDKRYPALKDPRCISGIIP